MFIGIQALWQQEMYRKDQVYSFGKSVLEYR